jgi:hypothetical protein
VIGMLGFNLDPAAADRLGAGLVESLGPSGDPDLIGAPSLQTALQGLVQYRMPPGGAVSESENRLSVDFRVRGEMRDRARVIFSLDAPRDFLAREILMGFNGPVDVRRGTFSDQPVWVIHGRPIYGFGSIDTRPGDAWRQTTYVMQSCLTGRGPLVIDVITTTDRISEGMTPTTLLAGFDIVLPPDATPCPTVVMGTLAAALDDPAMVFNPDAPQASVPAPSPTIPADVPPVSEAAPQPPAPAPKPTIDADATAWAAAQNAGSAEAVLGYLERWPRGNHAADARAWLASRAIMAPTFPDDRDSPAWQQALASGNAGDILAYLHDWPHGTHAAEARDWLTRRAIQIPADNAAQPPTTR